MRADPELSSNYFHSCMFKDVDKELMVASRNGELFMVMSVLFYETIVIINKNSNHENIL